MTLHVHEFVRLRRSVCAFSLIPREPGRPCASDFSTSLEFGSNFASSLGPFPAENCLSVLSFRMPSPNRADLRSPVHVGINGFGRIGRQVVRILTYRGEPFTIKHINSSQSAEYMKYLLEHDTVHGRFKGTCIAEEGALILNGHRITLSCTRDASKIPWAEAGVQYVAECTGAYLTTEKCMAHFASGGVKKVVISAPATDDTPTIVVGVNHDKYSASSMHVVSNASCTTNGLAPLVKVIHEKFGIAQGLMTTVHAATASQVTVDGTSAKDWRAGRAASANIIPSSTGAAKAVAKAYPAMKGRLTGIAVRVPVVDVSMVDLTCVLETPTTYEEIKAEIKLASETYAKGIVGYTEAPVVSSDFIGETRSTVFDATAGVMLTSTFVKLVSWYDNEWGYSSRLCDLIGIMAVADGCFESWWSWNEVDEASNADALADAESRRKGAAWAEAKAKSTISQGSRSADSVLSESFGLQIGIDDLLEKNCGPPSTPSQSRRVSREELQEEVDCFGDGAVQLGVPPTALEVQ